MEADGGPGESSEQMQARHRRELKDLQARVTSKKKNATKKTRKGVNDECAQLERDVRDRHAAELAAATGKDSHEHRQDDEQDEDGAPGDHAELAQPTEDLEQVSEASVQEQNQQQQQQSQQSGKKRNRHKERLARRAAEQEAATQRAEEEASGMTDHRARESEYMNKAFAANGLVERDIEPDGHCLFSAVADQLAQHEISLLVDAAEARATKADEEPAYRTVRRVAAAFMQENADDFAPFLDEDLAAYAARVRDTAEWGGQLELTALARRYGVEIRVVQDGRTECIGEDEGAAATGRPTLWLAYYRHGYGLGEHYNSLRRKTKP